MQPKIKEVKVSWSGDGKVSQQYSTQVSGYHGGISRSYEVPSSWTDAQVAEFELEVVADLKAQLEPLLQREHDDRVSALLDG